MWNDQGGGGGFNTPGSQTPGGGEKKRTRAQNLVPVTISSVLECTEESLSIEGLEVGMVCLLGKVVSISNEATKGVYSLKDKTAQIDVIQWLDEGQDASKDDVCEDMHARVIGTVRNSGGKKHIMAFNISPVEAMSEIKGLTLEVEYARLKIKQLKDKENSSINVNSSSSLSNSLVSGNNFSSSGGGGGGGGSNFSNPKHSAVFKMIAGCMREEGISKEEIQNSLKGRVGPNALNDALYFLSGEGHIYSTIDEDHFKTTDS
uniref:Replication protein A 32 kDa subunit n=1 Tax=Caligus rogercresseyi TaxID=217165 RepID=C1BNG9_CALRO|nr:Replication protein A 32 kDa subunit [Caligus rogercresseyi]